MKNREKFINEAVTKRIGAATGEQAAKNPSFGERVKKITPEIVAAGLAAAAGLAGAGRAETAPLPEAQFEQQLGETQENQVEKQRTGILGNIQKTLEAISGIGAVKEMEKIKSNLQGIQSSLEAMVRNQESAQENSENFSQTMSKMGRGAESEMRKLRQEITNKVEGLVGEIRAKAEEAAQKTGALSQELVEAQKEKNAAEIARIQAEMGNERQRLEKDLEIAQAQMANLQAETKLHELQTTVAQAQMANLQEKWQGKGLQFAAEVLTPAAGIEEGIAGQFKVTGKFGAKKEMTPEGKIKETDPGTNFELAVSEGLKYEPAASLKFNKDVLALGKDKAILGATLGTLVDYETNFRECLKGQLEAGERKEWTFGIKEIKPGFEAKLGIKHIALGKDVAYINAEVGGRMFAVRNPETGKWGFTEAKPVWLAAFRAEIDKLGLVGEVRVVGDQLVVRGEKKITENVRAVIEKGDMTRFGFRVEF